jgi:hypothetical protein
MIKSDTIKATQSKERKKKHVRPKRKEGTRQEGGARPRPIVRGGILIEVAHVYV